MGRAKRQPGKLPESRLPEPHARAPLAVREIAAAGLNGYAFGMTVLSESAIADHLDFLVMQPDQERAVVRDLVSAVLAFNMHSSGEPQSRFQIGRAHV